MSKERFPYNEKELLNQLASGSEAAFTVIYDFYRDRIYHTALHHTGAPAVAEEVVQDTFLQLWLKRTNAHTINNLRAYLHGIAEHLIYRAWKRIAQNKEKEINYEPAVQAAPDILLEHKDYEQIFRSAIERLPEKQKLTYRLIKESGLSRETVARQLNVSPETVKSNLDHAIRNIRAFCLARMGVSSAVLVVLKLM